MKLTKLTEKERKYAEENHNLIYSFLHRHGYSIEDYYNIAVFGYLKDIPPKGKGKSKLQLFFYWMAVYESRDQQPHKNGKCQKEKTGCCSD